MNSLFYILVGQAITVVVFVATKGNLYALAVYLGLGLAAIIVAFTSKTKEPAGNKWVIRFLRIVSAAGWGCGVYRYGFEPAMWVAIAVVAVSLAMALITRKEGASLWNKE